MTTLERDLQITRNDFDAIFAANQTLYLALDLLQEARPLSKGRTPQDLFALNLVQSCLDFQYEALTRASNEMTRLEIEIDQAKKVKTE